MAKTGVACDVLLGCLVSIRIVAISNKIVGCSTLLNAKVNRQNVRGSVHGYTALNNLQIDISQVHVVSNAVVNR